MARHVVHADAPHAILAIDRNKAVFFAQFIIHPRSVMC
jgi:hypothetical protein